MELFPLSLSLTDRKCLVVGSHPQAEPIVQSLVKLHARVVRLGCLSTPAPSNNIVVHDRPFQPEDLNDCWLVIAASESETENDLIVRLCDTRQLFCHSVTNPQNSSCLRPQEPQQQTTATVAHYPTYRPDDWPQSHGLVSLVGAGPGDPGLLTLRAFKLITLADAIVYDRLVSKPILEMCNPDAEFVYAGKAKAKHTLPQDSINNLLVQLARKYKNVVRLKGGDPFIFGRGGEEIETLADQNIEFQVVPGITAASGCAAFSGIPLTHRDHAQSCIFVTGHLRDGKINLNWQELTDPTQTIVVYMGLTGIDQICQTLIDYGRSAQTPAALIERGTNPEQRVLSSTLKDLPQMIAQSNAVAPTLLIIGGVVSLRDKLEWFNP